MGAMSPACWSTQVSQLVTARHSLSQHACDSKHAWAIETHREKRPKKGWAGVQVGGIGQKTCEQKLPTEPTTEPTVCATLPAPTSPPPPDPARPHRNKRPHSQGFRHPGALHMHETSLHTNENTRCNSHDSSTKPRDLKHKASRPPALRSRRARHKPHKIHTHTHTLLYIQYGLALP